MQSPLPQTGGSLGDAGNLLDSLGRNFISGKQTVKKSARPEDNNAVSGIIQELLTRSKDDAMYKDLVDNLFRMSAEQFAPTKAAEVSSGAYASSTTQLMQNDARARAVAMANQAILEAKQAALDSAGRAQIAQLEANTTTTAETKAPFDFLTKPFAKVGSSLGDTAGTVICTELHEQGKFPTPLLARSYRWAKINHSAATWKGYHAWGIPVAKKMKTSPLLTAVFGKIALSRAEYLHGEGSVFGLLVHITATPLCWLLGQLLMWRERRRLKKLMLSLYTEMYLRNMASK